MGEQAAAAAQQVGDAASKAASDVKARVDTAQAGKKLLDEGGPGMEKKLLGKYNSREAFKMDNAFVFYINKVTVDYKEAAEKMKTAGALTSPDQKAFQDLAESYLKRAASLEQALGALKPIPAVATISPVESDAITILTTKMQASGLHAKARSSISGATAGGNTTAESSEAPAEKKGFVESMQEKAKAGMDRAKERTENANSGMKIVNEGGDQMKTILLGKKASLDSTLKDTKLLDHLGKTIQYYKDGEANFKESLSEDKGDESPSLKSLQESYAARGAELEAVLSQISPAAVAIDTHESERDGIKYLCAQMGIQSTADSVGSVLEEAQAKVVQGTLNSAASSATGGKVTEVPEGSGAAAVKYAKENPEQAKAAMKMAADVAADSKGSGKGNGYS